MQRWRTLSDAERAAVEAEAASLPRPGIRGRVVVRWDEAVFRTETGPTAAARLLRSGDAFFLLQGADRDLLVPDVDRQRELWTPRVWPGALLVDGEIAGTWRRAGAARPCSAGGPVAPPPSSSASAAPGRPSAYTGDTAWTGAIAEAAADADLLIAEAYYRDRTFPIISAWPILTATAASSARGEWSSPTCRPTCSIPATGRPSSTRTTG